MRNTKSQYRLVAKEQDAWHVIVLVTLCEPTHLAQKVVLFGILDFYDSAYLILVSRTRSIRSASLGVLVMGFQQP